MELKDKNVIVTGGSSGIGKSIAKSLIDEGANVIITARGKKRLKNAAEEIDAEPIQADVSEEEDVDKIYSQFSKKYDTLDVLINNAGVGQRTNVDELTGESFEKVFGTNVYGTAMMTARAAKIFIKQDYGNIINIGSTAAIKGYPGGSVYVGSKFALRGMTACWKQELRQHNVRVMLVNPSEVQTAFGGRRDRPEKINSNKLVADDIAHAVKNVLTMENRGFIPELSVWATNPDN